MKKNTHNFTLNVTPMGKPRMTQRDRWKGRPVVKRYHAFKDACRSELARVGKLSAIKNEIVFSVSWVAYLPIPKSWTKAKKGEMTGQLHQAKPDRDNIDKAILDAFFPEDSGVATGTLTKRWDDGRGPRIEFEVLSRTPEGRAA